MTTCSTVIGCLTVSIALGSVPAARSATPTASGGIWLECSGHPYQNSSNYHPPADLIIRSVYKFDGKTLSDQSDAEPIRLKTEVSSELIIGWEPNGHWIKINRRNFGWNTGRGKEISVLGNCQRIEEQKQQF